MNCAFAPARAVFVRSCRFTNLPSHSIVELIHRLFGSWLIISRAVFMDVCNSFRHVLAKPSTHEARPIAVPKCICWAIMQSVRSTW